MLWLIRVPIFQLSPASGSSLLVLGITTQPAPTQPRIDPEDLDALRAALNDPTAVVWIIANDHDAVDVAIMRDVLQLHSLTIEDIVSDLPLPKIRRLGTYLYVAAHGVDQSASEPDSVRHRRTRHRHRSAVRVYAPDSSMRSVTAVRAELERGCHLFERGAAWIVHALLDHLIDHYLPLIDTFDDASTPWKPKQSTIPRGRCCQRIFALKRSLMKLRRVAVHQREILLRLSRDEFSLLPPPLLPFFRDVFDHFTRVADLCDSYRELVSGALEAYLTTTSNKMNEIMKVLTAIATIMLPLSFIAGVYGMNFELMPELKWRYGYPFALALMAVVAVSFVTYFRRRRWF